MKKTTLWIAGAVVLGALAVIAAFFVGWGAGWVARGVPPTGPAAVKGADKVPAGTIWTCSMHPQIRLHEPGNCPICGMALIPAESTEDTLGPRQLAVTPDAAKLMDIQVSPVERRFADVTVRMVGRVDYDESRVASIAAWIGGRIDRLYVDYTGIAVKKGDHMALLYSPDLLSAQEELIQAKAAAREMEKSSMQVVRDSAQATLSAARDKLRLWGITPDRIAEIESTGKLITQFPIVAPIGGIVVEKMAKVGMYVNVGERIYTIADLSQVWVKLDAYESDLPWVRYGQKVTFKAEALPGRGFTGTLAFIDPVVDAKTRTVRVRVNVPNPTAALKPDMFVHASLHAQVAADGRVMDPNLAGKWICYMHPEVIKDAPGACDICGMPLVRSEELGYVPANEGEAAKPLLIPASAPLITGKRAIVYVSLGDDNHPLFEGREVELGPRAGDYYVVVSGLADNDVVVTRGNFKIDSSLQLMAKKSMMNPEGGQATAPAPAPAAKPAATAKMPAPEAFRRQLGNVWTNYLALSTALAADDLAASRADAEKTRASLAAVDMKLLEGESHVAWMKLSDAFTRAGRTMADAKEIQDVRLGFALLSETLDVAIRAFGVESAGPVYRIHCPMAFANRGANWLSNTKEIRNPYFGAAMLTCGEVTDTLQAGDAAK